MSDAPHGGGSDGGTHDGPGTSPGFRLHLLGMDYMSTNQVTLRPSRSSGGVYQGYFEATTDLSIVPNIDVRVVADNGTLSSGMQASCARSQTANAFDETSVLIQFIDGDTYYTNVMPSASCTITFGAVSQTSATVAIDGTIYDEMDSSLTPQSFTLSFAATVSP